MKPKSALLLWLIAPSGSERPPLVCVCCLPALCHSNTFHYRVIPRTHQHMPCSFSVCLFQCWRPLFLLLWFRAMLSWRLLSGSTAKHPSPPCEPEKNSKLPHRIHMPFSWEFLDYCLLTISLWSITPVGRAHLL